MHCWGNALWGVCWRWYVPSLQISIRLTSLFKSLMQQVLRKCTSRSWRQKVTLSVRSYAVRQLHLFLTHQLPRKRPGSIPTPFDTKPDGFTWRVRWIFLLRPRLYCSAIKNPLYTQYWVYEQVRIHFSLHLLKSRLKCLAYTLLCLQTQRHLEFWLMLCHITDAMPLPSGFLCGTV